MATNFKLQIVTQEKIAFEGEIHSLIVPGESGYLGVMAHHAPLLAALKDGTITARSETKDFEGELDGGFLEVQNNVATILTNTLDGNFEIESE